jgi:hypothetical protein
MEEMNEQQSLKIITEMIQKAKNNIGNNSFYFLLWGWAVFAASLLHYSLLIINYELAFLPWPVLMTGASVVAAIYGYKDSKRTKVKSYFDKFFAAMWIAITVAIFLSLILITQVADFRASYIAVMLLYGLGTFVTGIVIRFKPLIIGGIIVWLCAVGFVWVDFPNALLLMALAILSSYIIPGYLLRNKVERKPQPAIQ